MSTLVPFLCLLVLSISGGELSNNDFVRVQQQVNGHAIKSTGDQSMFLLKVDIVQPNEYLFFLVKLSELESQWQKIKLVIYRNQGNVKLLDCQFISQDNCFIKNDLLKVNDTLKVMVQCSNDCFYEFYSYWTSIQKISINQTLPINFHHLRVGHFYQFEYKGPPSRIQFIIESNMMKSMLNRISIKGNLDGSLPTTEHHLLSSIPMWDNAHGLFINSQDIGNNKLTLLVVGQSDISHTLKCVSFSAEYRVLEFLTPCKDLLVEGSKHKFEIDLKERKGEDEIYAIDISLYSGELYVGLYLDQEYTKVFGTQPMLFKGTSRYLFSEKDLMDENITKLYLTLASSSPSSTYSITLLKEYMNQAAQIRHNVYQVIEVNSQQLFFIRVNQWPYKISADIQDIIVTVTSIGNNTLQPAFKTCNTNINDCTSIATYLTSTTTINTISKQIKDKQTIYRIRLDNQTYTNILSNPQKSIIVLELNVKQSDENNFIALVYNDENQIYDISQTNKGHEYALEYANRKYFYYNPNPNAKAVHIYFILIVGKVSVQSAREDPRKNPNTPITTIDVYNDMVFNTNLQNPIYLIVNAYSHSSFMLVSAFDGQTSDTKTLSILEYKQQNMIIKAGDTEIRSITPKYDTLTVDYDSTGAIYVCLVKQITEKCNDSTNPIANKASLVFKQFKASIKYYLKIINTNQKQSIQVTLFPYSGPKIPCLQKAIDKVYSDVVENHYCVTYDISGKYGLEGSIIRTEMKKVQSVIFICNNRYNTNNNKFLIQLSTIQTLCNSTLPRQQLMNIIMSHSDAQNINMKIQYIVKQVNRPVMLPDGIAYIDQVVIVTKRLNIYNYEMVNKVNTMILIHNQIGSVTAYAKIVDSKQLANTVITDQDYQLTISLGSPHLSGPQLFLSSYYLNNLKCQKCILIIVVYADTDITEGDSIKYTIEITQNHLLLNEHQIHQSLLYQGSIAYFRYQCLALGKTILLDVNDHSMQCAKIYVSNKQYPSLTNRISYSEGNQITINCDQKMYYFAVEAKKDCPISIVAQSSSYKLTNIKVGIPIPVNLKEMYQIQYFTYIHTKDQQFTVLSVEEYGNVRIYINQSTEEIINSIESGKVQLSKFAYKSTIDNVVVVKKNQSGYCINCLYLIAVISDSNLVRSSLYVVNDQNQPLIMETQKVLSDELFPNQIFKMKYFNVLKGKVAVTVHKGNVQIQIKYINKQQSHQISNNTSQFIDFDFFDPEINYNWDPLQLQVKNIGNSVAEYSLHISQANDILLNSYLMKSGVMVYAQLKVNKTFCFRGHMSNQKQKILISMNKSWQQVIQKVIISVKVNNQIYQSKNTNIKNIMEIQIQSKQKIQTKNNNFIICLTNSLNEVVSIQGLQNDRVSTIPSNKWLISRGEQIFMFKPKQQILFDILTCNGEVKYSLRNSIDELSKVSLLSLDSLEKKQYRFDQKNHVISYVANEQEVFLKISSNATLIKWFQVDKIKQLGVGYTNLVGGQLSENIHDMTIELLWNPIKPISQSNLKIHQTIYRIIIAKTPQQAKAAAHCEVFSNVQFYKVEIKLDAQQCQKSIKSQSQLAHLINKKQISGNFNKTKIDQEALNLYITLTADVQIIVPNTQPKQFEQYRFIYNSLQLPKTLVLFNGGVSKYYNIVAIIIGSIVFGIIAILIIVYLVLKKLIPLISRIKNRMLVEEEVIKGDSAPSMEIHGESEKKMAVDQEV